MQTYTIKRVLRAFQGLRELAAVYQNVTKRPYNFGRYMILEPILLWYWWIRHTNASSVLRGRPLTHFWIIEQDVAFSKPASFEHEFLDAYSRVSL